MSAHTPGPWHCKNADGKWASAMGWRVDHDDFRGGSWLPVRAGKKVLALAFCGDGPNSVRAEAELDANTCLIARAPDLLAENTRLTARVAKLEAALREIADTPDPDPHLDGGPYWEAPFDAMRASARAALTPEPR